MRVIGLVGLLALTPAATLAATFQLSGTVTEIFIGATPKPNTGGSPSFVDVAPFKLGDDLSVSVDVVDMATVTTTTPTSSFYRDVFVDVDGFMGGFAFEDGRNGLNPVVNGISVVGADGTGSSGDRVSGSRTVVGDSFGGWTVNTMFYRLISTQFDKLDDNAYGPFLFEQTFIDSFDFPGLPGIADRAEIQLNFVNPDFNGSVTAVADIRTPAPVPLPGAFGLLAVALGALGFVRRRQQV